MLVISWIKSTDCSVPFGVTAFSKSIEHWITCYQVLTKIYEKNLDFFKERRFWWVLFVDFFLFAFVVCSVPVAFFEELDLWPHLKNKKKLADCEGLLKEETTEICLGECGLQNAVDDPSSWTLAKRCVAKQEGETSQKGWWVYFPGLCTCTCTCKDALETKTHCKFWRILNLKEFLRLRSHAIAEVSYKAESKFFSRLVILFLLFFWGKLFLSQWKCTELPFWAGYMLSGASQEYPWRYLVFSR